MVKPGIITPAVAQNVSITSNNSSRPIDLKSDIFSKLCALDENANDLTKMDIEDASKLKGKYGINNVSVSGNTTTVTCSNGESFEFRVKDYTTAEKVEYLKKACESNSNYEVVQEGNNLRIIVTGKATTGGIKTAFGINDGVMMQYNGGDSAFFNRSTNLEDKEIPYCADGTTHDYDGIKLKSGDTILIPLNEINPPEMNRYYKEDPVRKGEVEAYNAGTQFALDAIGYTTKSEHKRMLATISNIEKEYTPEQTVIFLKGYYEEKNFNNSGIFEQLASENNSSKITNGEACAIMKKIIDAVGEDKRNTKDYERLTMTYNSYNNLDKNALFEEKDSWFSRIFGTASLDNLDDAIERLLDL